MTTSSVQQEPGGREVATVLATQAWLLVTGTLSQSLLAYTLHPEGRGAYAVCTMFAILFGVLFAPGSDRGAQYFLMSGRYSVSQGVSVATSIVLLGSLIAGVVGVFLFHSDLEFFKKASLDSLYLALPLIPLTALSTAYQLQLAGLRRFRRLALTTVVHATSMVMGVILLVVVADLGVNGAVLASMLGTSAGIATSLWDLRRNCGLSLMQPERGVLRDVVEYGRKYYIARVGTLVDLQIGALFLASFAAQFELGVFTASSALVMRLFSLSNAIESSLLPRVAGNADGRATLVGQCARLSALATGAVLAIIVPFCEPIVRLLLSESFLPAVPMIRAMATGVFLYSGASILMAFFRGTNRPEVCSRAVWVGLTSNLTTLVLLYPHIGAEAAGWAMSVGYLCRSLFLTLAFRRAAGVSVTSLWRPRWADASFVVDAAKTTLRHFRRSAAASDA